MSRLLPLAVLLGLGLACDGLQPVNNSGIEDPDQVLDTDAAVDTADTLVGGNNGDGNGNNGGNTPPRAYAGADQVTGILPGTTVQLDGSGSTDLDGDPLTFAWALLSKPVGSSASLSSEVDRTTSLYVDVAGDYQVQLIVHDGRVASAPDTVFVRVADDNKSPVANAGVDLTVTVGEYVQLDGSGSSDPDGDELEYYWTLVYKPSTSIAQLNGTSIPSTAVRPTFVADVAGTYSAQLKVYDGEKWSPVDNVSVTARPADQGGGSSGTSSSGSSDCLDCAASSLRVAEATWSAGNVASSFGLLMLPMFVALWQRRRDD